MKKIIILFAALTVFISAKAVEPDFSVLFAQFDSLKLELDVYMPKDTLNDHYCVIYAFGGSFTNRNQRQSRTKAFCRRLADDGYVAIATDYRLGLENVPIEEKTKMIAPFGNAVHIAAEDMISAVSFVLDKSDEWKIRKDGIILCGSSAGAITSLQADYELCNRTEMTGKLAEDFRFAGIVSFAGAIFSTEGMCKYKVHQPAPTLFLHGTEDTLVPYDNISFSNYRFSGSNDLYMEFKNNGWPYEIIRFTGRKHSVANSMDENYEEMMWFLDNFVKAHRNIAADKTISDFDYVAPSWDK